MREASHGNLVDNGLQSKHLMYKMTTTSMMPDYVFVASFITALVLLFPLVYQRLYQQHSLLIHSYNQLPALITSWPPHPLPPTFTITSPATAALLIYLGRQSFVMSTDYVFIAVVARLCGACQQLPPQSAARHHLVWGRQAWPVKSTNIYK